MIPSTSSETNVKISKTEYRKIIQNDVPAQRNTWG
jgi:hypothetical protein